MPRRIVNIAWHSDPYLTPAIRAASSASDEEVETEFNVGREHEILMDLFAPEQRRGRAFNRLFRQFVEVSQRFPEGQRAWRAEALRHARNA